jgi:hypothetical protein
MRYENIGAKIGSTLGLESLPVSAREQFVEDGMLKAK